MCLKKNRDENEMSPRETPIEYAFQRRRTGADAPRLHVAGEGFEGYFAGLGSDFLVGVGTVFR